MKFRPTTKPANAKRRAAAFTLAEVLAALVFMAIVIPVAVQGLQVANLAGTVALRKAAAARIGESALNEALATGTWKNASPNGSVEDGAQTYRWLVKAAPWDKATLQLVTVQVTFLVQGQAYDVELSTLADNTVQ